MGVSFADDIRAAVDARVARRKSEEEEEEE